MPSKNLPKKNINESDFFLISELAELLHVSTHTIRNLERDFSIEVKKDVNGKRVYVFSDVEKYRKLIDKKSEFDHSVSTTTPLEAQNTQVIKDVTVPTKNTNPSRIQMFSNFKLELLNKIHSLSYTFRTICKFSLAMFLIATFTSYGSFLLDKYLDIPVNLLGNGDNLYSRNNVSNVLQSTDENWEYRFDVNIPAYFNTTLFSSEASIDLIRVGTNVTITPEGVFAPNVINSINTLAGESLLLVDITDPNNPVLSVQENPSFATLEIESLTGVTEIDDVTIGTIEGLLNIPAGGTDAQTLEGLASADFLRSNANTTYTNGIMTFDASSSLKFNNLNPNTFLRVDSNNNLISYDLVAGSNVNFTTTANSLIINVNAIATSSQSSSVAVGSLFLGGTTFDTNYLILANAQEINKLYTLSGNIITSSNFSSTLLSSFVNIDTDATNDIITSNLASSILSSFPNIDTDATNDVLISSLAALMLSNYPNLDTNALDDVDLLQDAVLVTTGSAKNVYSINTWFGYQNFSNISGSLIEVEENGKLVLNPGVLPSVTNNSLYNYSDRLYFEELPLIQVASHVVSDHANKFAFFTTDASNRLLLTGFSTINLSNLQTGAASSILGMDGSTLRYLSVGGDLSVSTTSSSTITFTLNNVNSTTGTFGGSFAVPVITVNSKGQVTSITTTPFNDYYTSNISFSVPSSGSRTLRLQQNGLADLTSTFTLLPSDITSALGYIPLRNTTDSLTGNFGVSGNFSAASASFNSIALSNALSVNYGGTGLTQTPANGQLIIGNAGGYSLSSLISGTNISILTGPGSITISSTDTTNPNNYVTAISFSTPQATQRTLTLTREGLSNLTATFSISSSDITTALGYTPLSSADTSPDKYLTSLSISTDLISQNVELEFLLGWNDSTSTVATTFLTPAVITTALGYVPQANLGYTPLKNTTDTLTGNLGVSGNFSASLGSFSTLNATNSSIGTLTLTNALGIIYGGTGLTQTPANGQLLIGNAGGYSLSTLIAGSNVQITTGAGSITISSTDTTNPNHYVTGINFSIPAAAQRTLVLSREGLSNLTATFSLSASDITTALGYTPVNRSGDTIAGSLTINSTLSAATIFQSGNRVCDESGNCNSLIISSGSAGYITYFSSPTKIINSQIYQDSLSDIGIGTTAPGEKLDVYGAIKLSADMGTGPRTNALYQDGGVLYWNGQAVGVVGSTAPGGISGTKDYFPYFNTNDTLIASDFKYNSTSSERGLELLTSSSTREVYLALGHSNSNTQARLGVAGSNDAQFFYSRFESHDDLILENDSNNVTSDIIFSSKNYEGRYLFTFGKNDSEAIGVLFRVDTLSNSVMFGINNTNPTNALDVTGNARFTGTLAASTFSNPNSNNFRFLSGANFNGNLSAATATLTSLTLANALAIVYGGTGITQTPANGQLLIGNGSGYNLASLTAGTNVSITTGAGSITINSSYIDTTGPNNFVTSAAFTDSGAGNKLLTLTREGLPNLTAVFSLSSSDITTALGYTPLRATDTTADKFINSFTTNIDYVAPQNVEIEFSLARSDSTVLFSSVFLTPQVITTALGYTPLKNTTDSLTGNLGVSGEFSAGASTLTSLGVTNAFSAASGFITNAFGIGGAFSAASGSITNNFEIGGTLGVSNAFSAGASILNSLGVTNAFSAASGSITNNFGIGGALGVTGAFSAGSSTLTSLGVTNAFSAGSGNITNAFGVGGAFSAASAVITNALSAGSIGTTGSLSAATGTFTTLNATNSSIGTLTLTNALGIIYGGTGLTQTPANGQLLIGNSSGGYTLASFVAGTNVQITNASGSITINSTDTNNFVSSIAFSTPFAGQRIFTLQRTGLSDLTASFTLSTADITTALGYTPVSRGGDSMAGNLTFYNYVMAGTDLTVGDNFYIGDYLNNTNNLQIEPSIGNVSRKFVLDLNSDTLGTNATMKLLIRSVSFSTPFSGSDKNLTFNFLSADSNVRLDITKTGTIPAIDANVLDLTGVNLTAATASIQTLQLSNALGVSFGGTGLTQTPANGQILIGNAGGYSLATLVAGSNVQVTTGAGSITISSTDTTNPNNFVSAISFSTPASGQRTLVLQRDLLSDLTANFSLDLSDIITALGYTPLRNTTDTLTGNLGVSGNFSAASGSITNAFQIGGTLGVNGAFSAASAVISGNFSAGNSTLASALVLGNLTLSNPSGITALDFYANGASGDNIMMRSNFGNQVLAQINQDSTNALEIENFATGGLTNFNFPNNGQFNIYISDTPNNATNKLVLNQTFNDLNLFTNLNVGGTFSAGASRVSSLGVTNAFSAASGSVTGGLGVGGRFSTGLATLYEGGAPTNSNPGMFVGLSGSWGNLGNRAISAYVYPRVASNTFAGANSAGEASWLIAFRDAGGQDDGGTLTRLIGQQIYWGIYPRANQTPRITEAFGLLLVPYLGAGTISTYAAIFIQAEGTGLFDDATVTNKWSIYSEWNAPSFFAGSFSIGGTLRLGTGGTAANAQAVCRNSSTGVLYFSSSNCITSSIRYKENVKDMSYSLTDIEKLRPVEYNYINYDPLDTKQTKNRIGFIAEEMQNVIPEVVFKNDYGEIEGLDYMFLTALLTKGIQEQQVQIQNLSNAVSSLNVSSLETLVESLNNTLDSLSMSTENGALVVNSGLTVTGEALFNNATFTGDVAIGQMKFDSLNNDISISGMPCTNIDGTLNESLCNTQTLFVMKNKAGNINFFDGKVLINPNGEMTLEKITVGEVAAAKVSASEYEVMAGSDISGNTKILTGQNEVTILTSKVKENSKVFITPTGSLEGSSIYVDSKLGGVSFTVKLSSPLSKEIEFDWFILNSE